MPPWTPSEEWKGQDVFIIGGGPSLRNFDWTLLHDENTIGCNTAFTLGVKVCKICIFGDFAWWLAFKDELEQYKGTVFTNITGLRGSKVPWLWTMDRKSQGLAKNALGWNGNTGAAAINLALLLGAKKVFLLGFDMKRIADKPNWHNQIIRPEATKPYIYQGFVHDFRYVVRDWKALFADREIINVTKDSGLNPAVFPWIDPEQLWAERRAMRQEDLRLRQMAVAADNERAAETEENAEPLATVPSTIDRPA